MQKSIISLHLGTLALCFNSQLNLSINVEYAHYYYSYSFLTTSKTEV